MTIRPPPPSTDDGVKPSVQSSPATSHDRPLVKEQHASEAHELDEQERARLQRTERYLKGPTAFSA